jgi:hypothetical protein
MVASSQPLAAQVGLQVLKDGGNAVDAAIAVAAMVNVTEPMMNGLGATPSSSCIGKESFMASMPADDARKA